MPSDRDCRLAACTAPTAWPIRALTSTRSGGASSGAYRSLNLAGHVGDNPRAVAENRRRLIAELALPAEPAWLDQVHGANALELKGLPPAEPADAAVTRAPGVVLAVLTADCLPVVLSDAAGTVSGVVHAGWRGMAAGVIESAIDMMAVAPARLVAWLGPAIGPAAYEVGGDVRAAFVAGDPGAARAFAPAGSLKWRCDLHALARRRLASAGVAAISGGECCTYNDSEQFFSWRRDGQCGRMATLAWLAPRQRG